ADHRHGRAVGSIVGLRERSAVKRGDTHRGEVVARHEMRLPALRLTALAGPVGFADRDCRLAAPHGGDRLERQRLAPEKLVHLGREEPPLPRRWTAGGSSLADARVEEYETRRLANRQRLKQD